MLSDRLKGKVAVVTGSGNGIGKGVALMLARHGARVMGCDIDVAAAASTVAEAKREGLPVESLHPCDLTQPADVQRLTDAAVQRYGGIDALINAGAWGAFKMIEDMEHSDWRRTLEGELDVVFNGCKAAWAHLKARGGGSIVNFASANAYQALKGSGALAHCAGKGGVLAMTRQLAMEGGPHNIRANSISPGMIVTAATKPVLEQPGFLDNVLTKTMIKRVGQPEDIAWFVTFLISDEATWLTGADYHIDGGATAW
jgi:NAD(P)-dependent dehydrogenase (short-subunit alcohol dehydrogenase family)